MIMREQEKEKDGRPGFGASLKSRSCVFQVRHMVLICAHARLPASSSTLNTEELAKYNLLMVG